MFRAKIGESLQALLLHFSKTKSKMVAIIATEEFAIEFYPPAGVTAPGYNFADQLIETCRFSSRKARRLFAICSASATSGRISQSA